MHRLSDLAPHFSIFSAVFPDFLKIALRKLPKATCPAPFPGLYVSSQMRCKVLCGT